MLIRLTIPILIERVSEEAERRPYYAARPVFFDAFTRNGEREDLAVDRLTNAMRFAALDMAKSADHRGLARWGFYPALARHHVKLLVRLRKSTFEGRFFFVVFEEFDRRVAFCPRVPEVCFELGRGETLVDRAQDVLTEHYRRLEKDGKADPSAGATAGFARLGEIAMELQAKQTLPPDDYRIRFADITSGEKMDGAEELERVGRCLNRLHPKRLQRAILREKEVGNLFELFERPKLARRPVVLVGKSLVGKTSVIHEWVRKRIEEGTAKGKMSGDGRVWLLNPQRLVSGMCYVGQWEERLLAIVREARKCNFVLYFDDLLGTFQAGKSRDSELSMGHLLKAQMEEKPLEVVAEATPEAWRRLKERDRGFADLFQVVHMREPSDAETLRILIRVLQDIESARKCRFDPAVLPLVMELQRRYARSRAFPGKAAEHLHQVAASMPPGATISVSEARVHFQRKTGIARIFLDGEARLPRKELQQFFDERIVGQEAAVSAMIDAIAISKARLNDPGRPLASMLFLGPTGVGKTECAKAMAEFVFGSAERMLRIDMNEYGGPDAVARLIGDASRPRGFLTGALQRQPYSVLLLDEVEKAHESVFDLLLQVLGDGRLTDAGGHTADFCNAIVILTSNLGARQSRVPLGFAPDGRDESGVYVEAAEKFFRPEFFNRLDRVIPFHELTRAHIEGMVERLAHKALGRFGFRQRKMMLTVDASLYEKIVNHGFDPEYGARALRRAIEEHLVQPLAAELARTRVSALRTVRIVGDDEGRPVLESAQFVEAERHPACREAPRFGMRAAEAVVEAADAFCERASRQMEKLEEALDEEEADYAKRAVYFDMRDRVRAVRRSRERLSGFLESQGKIGAEEPRPPSRFGKRATRLHVPFVEGRRILEELNAAADAVATMKNLAEEAVIVDLPTFLCQRVICEATMASLAVGAPPGKIEHMTMELVGGGSTGIEWWENYSVLFPLANLADALPGGEAACTAMSRWPEVLSTDIWLDAPPNELDADEVGPIAYAGLGLRTCFALELGTHLFYRNWGGAADATLVEAGELPHGDRKVIRAHAGKLCFDLRSGIIAEGWSPDAWQFLAPLLPVPPEFEHLPGS